MKVTLVLLLVAVFCVFKTFSYPVEDAYEEQQDIEGHLRLKRATCDLGSIEVKGFKLNHAACAAHCLVRGRTGGYCNSKRVCICR